MKHTTIDYDERYPEPPEFREAGIPPLMQYLHYILYAVAFIAFIVFAFSLYFNLS